jgi:2-hydroxycyclohexanecarboxyl-CoA dehydrogenase
MMEDKDAKGKAFLISGGTAGIGLVAARKLLRHGARVAITGRSAERGAKAVEELKEYHSDVFFLQGDAGSVADNQRITAAAVERMGRLDSVISIGAQPATGMKAFADMTFEEMRDGFTNLVFPRILPVHAAIPYLRTSGGGSVVMIGTDAARHPTPGESIVGAAGAVVILMTKALARELARDLIRVNTVALTITSGTPGWDRVFAHEFGSKVFSKALERFPFGRPPGAEEVADAVVFLATDAASQISGQTVSVNGALSFGGW